MQQTMAEHLGGEARVAVEGRVSALIEFNGGGRGVVHRNNAEVMVLRTEK